MYRMLIAAVAVLLAPDITMAQPASVPADDVIRQILTRLVDSERRAVGLVVGVVDADGRRVVGHGRLASDDSRAPDADTVFEIGSITKVFTALVLADMVERGDARLDAPVRDLLGPDARVPSRDGVEITPLHLATHSSGLPRLPDNLDPADPANPYADYTTADLLSFLSSYALTRPIGELVEYSNLGAGLLGHALATRAGTDYETLVTSRVLDPLSMIDTSISMTPSTRKRLAHGHDAALEPVPGWDIPALAGAGALRSTANDLLTFLEANLGFRESPLRAAMDATHRSRRPFGPGGMDIGLGWLIRSEHEREIHWHSGGTGGYGSFIGFDRNAGAGVVVLSNTAREVVDLGFHLLDRRFALAEAPQPRTEIELAPDVYDEYAGRYQLVRGVIITVTREGDALFVQLTGQQKIEVFPESETDFFMRVVDAQITFGRSDAGAVDHLVLHQNGVDQRAPRLPDGVDAVDFGPAESVAVAEPVLERYVGQYELQPGFFISVTRNGGQLSAQVTGQPAAEIFASSPTEFFYRVVDAQITFRVEGDQVVGLTLHQAGRDLPARRLPN